MLEFWLSGCYSCVKWFNDLSNLFPINFGVRQGSVLSPSLFAIYLDDLARSSSLTRGMYVIMYADDILLITCLLYTSDAADE